MSSALMLHRQEGMLLERLAQDDRPDPGEAIDPAEPKTGS